MPFFAQSEWMLRSQRIWLWVVLTVPATLLVGLSYVLVKQKSKEKHKATRLDVEAFDLNHLDSEGE